VLACASAAGATPAPVSLTSRLPASATVGTPFTVRLTARGRPALVARGPATRVFATRRTAPGRCAATVSLGAAGRWTLSARLGGRLYRLGTVTARKRAPQPIFFAQPAGIAARPDGTLLVVEARANRIARIDPSTGAVTKFAEGLNNPYAIAVAPNGDVYVTDQDRLVRIDGSGHVTPLLTLPDIGPVAVDAQGVVYVSTSTDIYRLDQSGTAQHFAGTDVRGGAGDGGPAASAQINHPHGLLVTADGALLIADTDNHAVRRIDPVTHVITTVWSGMPGVAGLCAAPNGDLYATDFTDDKLERLDPGGPVVIAGTAAGTSLDTPLSCAVAGGDVYVVEAGGTGTIRVVHPDGSVATLSK
jgi:sugar lactone lactonase YvrE